MHRILASIIVLLQFASAVEANSCEIPVPKGEVILVIDGMINVCNEGSGLRLDREMIEALPAREVRTENPWEDGKVAYQGVLMRDLLTFAKANGGTAVVSALNDYRADIPVDDINKYDVILAVRRGGEYLSVRDKGPLFVVFPFSDVPGLASETRYAQSVWQVNRITLK